MYKRPCETADSAKATWRPGAGTGHGHTSAYTADQQRNGLYRLLYRITTRLACDTGVCSIGRVVRQRALRSLMLGSRRRGRVYGPSD